LAAEGFFYPLADGEKVSVLLPGPGFVYAPVVRGQAAGNAHILVDGQSVGQIPLIYGQTVEFSPAPEKKPSWLYRLFGGLG
jgi:hypothetical protein